MTHSSFAPWCSFCVKARAREAPHRRIPETDARAEGRVYFDFCYFQDDPSVDEVGGHKDFPVLVGIDSDSGALFAVQCMTKKASDAYLDRGVRNFLSNLGATRLTIQVDAEQGLHDLIRNGAKNLMCPVTIRRSATRDPQSHGP